MKKTILFLFLITFIIGCSEELKKETFQPSIYGDPWNPVQVTFEVTVPDYTPKDDQIYLIVDEYVEEIGGELSRGNLWIKKMKMFGLLSSDLLRIKNSLQV
jgi:hypothetical protein